MKLDEAIRLAKYAGKQAGKYANVDNAKRFTQHVVPEVVRPARVIWNQAIGALFFVIAIPALVKAIQLYRGLPHDPNNGFGLVISCIFVSVMVIFGVASFVKARNISSRPRRS